MGKPTTHGIDSRRDAKHLHALRRLNHMEDVRIVAQGIARGRLHGVEQIAAQLGTSRTKATRLLRETEGLGGEVPETPEEIILRAYVDHTDRGQLVSRLSDEIDYTYGESAPYPFEGHLPGTWDQVVEAMATGYLSTDEFREIKSRVTRRDVARHDVTRREGPGDGGA